MIGTGLLALLLGVNDGPVAARGFLAGAIETGGERLAFALYLPRDYAADRRWPLVLFLHGSGECGRDGWRQLTQGLPPAMLAAPERWPVIALMPQKPEVDRDWEEYEPALLELLARTMESLAVDRERVYLTGLSQGGHGTWVLGSRHPELFAALAPVCGYGASRIHLDRAAAPPRAFTGVPDDLAPGLAKVPIWAFHGVADPVVPVSESENLARAAVAQGGNVRLSLFEGVGHGAWDRAYRDEGLEAWLLAQRSTTRAPVAREREPR